MGKKKSCDRSLLILVICLSLFGLAMVYSASAVISMEMTGSTHYFFVKHAVSLIIGLSVMAVVMRLDYRLLSHPAAVYTIVLGLLGLLFAVLFTPPVNNTHRWFTVGRFAFQPSEFAKIALVIFFAYMLAKKKERINDLVGSLLPIMIILGQFVFLIVIEPDMGTAFVILAIGMIMLFLAGLQVRYMIACAGLAIPVFIKLVLMEEWRRKRLLAFLNPLADPRGYGFQPIQSLIGIGSGGLTGLGPGGGRQKLFFLPEPHTDFIYAVIGEELGFIGAVAILLAFLFIMWRGIRIALNASDSFGFYLGMGLTSLVVFQVLFNVSVVLSLVPTKGISLPFISAGGSSLLAMLTAVGLMLSISYRS